MKVGDILILVDNKDWKNQPYTAGKHYVIYKTNYMSISGYETNYGFIRNDNNDEVYFPEERAEIEGWRYLHRMRKEKLEKLNNYEKL